VPAHDLSDLRQVRRAPGSCRQHLVNLTEVVGRHDTGAGYRQELGVFGPEVLESVAGPRDTRKASPGRMSSVRPSTVQVVVPSKSVDRLLEGVVTVRRRHLAVGGNEALEDARASVQACDFNPPLCMESDHPARWQQHPLFQSGPSRGSQPFAETPEQWRTHRAEVRVDCLESRGRLQRARRLRAKRRTVSIALRSAWAHRKSSRTRRVRWPSTVFPPQVKRSFTRIYPGPTGHATVRRPTQSAPC
jgi:hypothetical protein